MSRSAPIPIAIPSSGLYVPVHRRGISSSYSSSSRASSPASSSSSFSPRSISPFPREHTTTLPIYTPADLLLLSSSPLSRLSSEEREALREVAPDIVRNRKQRKAYEWQSRHKATQSHRRAPSDTLTQYSTSESEGETRGRKVWKQAPSIN